MTQNLTTEKIPGFRKYRKIDTIRAILTRAALAYQHKAWMGVTHAR